jgi:GH35 family endo-1,4-beta-xylanase
MLNMKIPTWQCANLLALLLSAACSSEASRAGNSDDGGALLDGATDLTDAGGDSGSTDGAVPGDDGSVPGDMDAGQDAGGTPSDSSVPFDADSPDGDAAWDCSSGEGLRCLAIDKLIGTAMAAGPLADATYAAVLAREFDTITPENATKWGELEPTQGTWSFETADRVLRAAELNDQTIKAHTLVWHIQAPSWVSGLNASDLSTALHQHITTTVGRYRGRVRAWDVVNEAIADDSLTLRAGMHQTLGAAGLAEAFKLTRSTDPDALLFYNDYAIESPSPKTDAVLALVEQLLGLDAPIDGVGLQAHLSTKAFPSEAGLREVMQRIAAMGLRVNISELDVRTAEVPGSAAARRTAQRIVYQLMSGVCATEPACEGVTLWGFTDAHSWVDETFGADDPLPFNESYEKKPAYAGLESGLQGTLPTSGANIVANGECSGATSWYAFGGGTFGNVASGHAGTGCRVSARTAVYQGPGQSFLGKISSGDVLSATAWVRISSGSHPVRLTVKSTIGGVDTYTSIAAATARSDGWTRITGAATFGWTTEPSSLELYFEGPPAGVNVLVDDFTLQSLTSP